MAELTSIKSISENGEKNDTKKIDRPGKMNHTFNQLNPQFLFNSDSVPLPRSSIEMPQEVDLCALMSKRSLVKNMLVLGFSFLMLFTAFQTMSNYPGGSKGNNHLSNISLEVVYGSLVVSCLLFPTIIISWLGLKTTIVLSMLAYGIYFAANFDPNWYTMVPASVVLGLAGGPLWTAQCAYLSRLAGRWANLTGEHPDISTVRFFGIFFMIFQTGQVWGNSIAYGVMKPHMNQTDYYNDTFFYEDGHLALSHCGVEHCNVQPHETNNRTSDTMEPIVEAKFHLLYGIFTCCALLASFVVLVGLDPLKSQGLSASANGSSTMSRATFSMLFDTFRQTQRPYQLLLIPLTFFSGVEQAYITGDFPNAFVTCAWGVRSIGFVMICYGVSDAFFSGIVGSINKRLGRMTVISLGFTLNIASITAMFLWQPKEESKALYFVIVALWGSGDAIWQTQINSLHSVLFPQHNVSAFANYRMWESLGFVCAIACNAYLCTSTKLYMMIGSLVIGFLSYLVIELHLRKPADVLPKRSFSGKQNS